MTKQLIIASIAGAALLAAGCSSSGGSSDSNTSGAGAAGGASPSSSSASSTATSAVAVTITLQGGHLVGPDGKALYTENVDTATTFGCNGGCLTAWPPVLGAPKAAGGVDQDDFATRARPDGTMQVTYDGKPLYEFQADTAPGDTKGDGVNEGGILWTLAKSDDAPATSPSSSDDDSSGSSSSGSGGGGYGY